MSENVGLVCNRRRYRLVVRTPDCGSGNLSSNLSTVNLFYYLYSYNARYRLSLNIVNECFRAKIKINDCK